MAGRVAGGAALAGWLLLGGGSGCLSSAPAAPGCLDYASKTTGTSGVRLYDYPGPQHTVDGRGVDWIGSTFDGVKLDGDGSGCLVGGRVEGSFDPNDVWDLYHDRKAVVVSTEGQPFRVEKSRAKNYGDGVSLSVSTPCPNGSSTWLTVTGSHFEDIHDDAIESDGLCGVEIHDNLIERTFVAFAFRNRTTDPYRNGSGNTVIVKDSLVRMHAFANNYLGGTRHNGFWKWAGDNRGPKVIVRRNRFLAFDAPAGGTLFPYVNKVVACEDNVLLFAGSEAEWQQALTGACNSYLDDDLCDGERMLALAGCYTVITKPDTQSEAAFLAAHWDPYVASWKASHSADDE